MIFLFGILAQMACGEQPSNQVIREASQRALAITQRSHDGFNKVQQCFSCHNHALPALAFQSAREHGLHIDESKVRAGFLNAWTHSMDLRSIDLVAQGYYLIDPGIIGWALVSAHAAGVSQSLTTAMMARQIANWQEGDGSWTTADQRPPSSHSRFTTTAIAMRALQLYMPNELEQETINCVDKARRWLKESKPITTEDATYRLMGLIWSNAAENDREAAGRDLLSLQRSNGGWAQLSELQPDAYSTAEAILALSKTKANGDSNLRRGVAYLLSSQAQDGSWHVRTRMVSPAPVSPPFFETGFPYGKDQFLSISATVIASMALMESLPKIAHPAHPQPLHELKPIGEQPWMRTALFGSSSELKSLLDQGLDINSRTDGGTTLLMMSAKDPQKVHLLIARGVDVNVKAKSGFTAIMAASMFRGTSDSVKAILAKGAEAAPGTGVKFNASPFFFATWARDTSNMAILKSHGADPNKKFLIAGTDLASPLLVAALYGSPSAIKTLSAAGADFAEREENGLTALHFAVFANQVDAAKALIEAGSPVNAADKWGYTPLHYAATVFFGDTSMVRMLREAGAALNVKNKEGKTPLAQAQQYGHVKIQAALAPAKSKK